MANRLILKQDMWQELRSHLLQDTAEHLAFALAEYTQSRQNRSILVRELLLIKNSELDAPYEHYGISIDLSTLIEVMNTANKSGHILIEAHSHPFSWNDVAFSLTDYRGQREMFRHLQDVSPGKPYGALVMGRNSFNGLLWLPESDKPVSIDEIKLLSDSIETMRCSDVSQKDQASTLSLEGDRYNRQILALGIEGQHKISNVRVGIVGLGGIGSMVANQLAYLGVRDYVLIDDDLVEETNLNRLIGATASNIGQHKVEVFGAVLNQIIPGSNIVLIKDSVRTEDALEALKDVDVIFGCVDTDSGRMILNELAVSYMMPLIDCGSGIEVDNDHIVEAGGRVIVWIPGRPCLFCAREFIPRIAIEELESAKEYKFREEFGYIAGADIKNPAVVSLNSTVASIAVTEFIALVTGFRPSIYFRYYDMLSQKLDEKIITKDNKCPICALEGIGDKCGIRRYSRQELPSDIPSPGIKTALPP